VRVSCRRVFCAFGDMDAAKKSRLGAGVGWAMPVRPETRAASRKFPGRKHLFQGTAVARSWGASFDNGYSSPHFSIHRTDIIAAAVVTVGFARHEAFPDSAVVSPRLLMGGIVGASPTIYGPRTTLFIPRDVVVGRRGGHGELRGAGGLTRILGSAACSSPRGTAPGSDERLHRDG
jgi:hypothetical protein